MISLIKSLNNLNLKAKRGSYCGISMIYKNLWFHILKYSSSKNCYKIGLLIVPDN